MIARTPLQELVERLRTVARVAKVISLPVRIVQEALQGKDADVHKIAYERAERSLKWLAEAREKSAPKRRGKKAV